MSFAEDERFEALSKKKRKSPRLKTRAKVKDIFDTLGEFARRTYRMTFESFVKLFRRVKDNLQEQFCPNGGHRCERYNIKLSLRLSCAIRWFAGGSTYDIMLNHTMSHNEVYESVWGCVDAVNKCKDLDFPGFSHAQQKEYAEGFFNKSDAGFDTVIAAVDGMLVWTRAPTEAECELARTGQGKFKCTRKGKYGVNMQAACDAQRRFLWVSIITPGTTSDYLSYVTADLIKKLQIPGKLLPDHVFVGDNAYIKSVEMATPIKNASPGLEDDYNFYLSQLRIIIECAFGILVQRWGILRRPLLCGIEKIPALVTALCKLHNFCIDMQENAPGASKKDLRAIARSAAAHSGGGEMVTLDKNQRPVALLNTADGVNRDTGIQPCRLETRCFAMDKMVKQVEFRGLKRPPRRPARD